MGLKPVPCPLFEVEAVAWAAPEPRTFDFVLFTSANAPRHGGDQLASLTTLPALAVGQATAEAARAAGFRVVKTGEAGIDSLLAALPGSQRLIHLTGVEHRVAVTAHAIETVVIYHSIELAAPVIPSGGLVALVHSPRAAARFAEVARDRAGITIAAISAAAAAACGHGWNNVAIAEQPSDGALLALAARLCQD